MSNKIVLLQVDLLNIKEKLAVAVVGYEINLVEFTIEGWVLKQIFIKLSKILQTSDLIGRKAKKRTRSQSAM